MAFPAVGVDELWLGVARARVLSVIPPPRRAVSCEDDYFPSFEFLVLVIHLLLLEALVGVQFCGPRGVHARKVFSKT